jgi:hypothetical protein
MAPQKLQISIVGGEGMLRGFLRCALCVAQLTAVASVSAYAQGARLKEASANQALDYLEGLKGINERYKAPSELDPRYTVALYVNTATRGAWRQRMWVPATRWHWRCVAARYVGQEALAQGQTR